MKWSQIPVMLLLLVPACSLLVQNENYYDGNYPTSGGAAGSTGAQGGTEADAAGAVGLSGGAGMAGAPEAAGGMSSSSGGGGSSSISGSGGSGSPSTCDTDPVCTPGNVDPGKQSCGDCSTGTQTRSRTCTSDCTWGAWSSWSACSGVTAACTPKHTSACTNNDPCGQRTCSDSCTWGACAPKTAGGCLRIRSGHTDPGSNFKCCSGTGSWSFCLSSCEWSDTCASCSKGAPDYCTECY